ncbi:MAG: DUF3383 domain-containing protein [Burkholderia gladioli]
MSIPAKDIVNVQPGVVAAAGSAFNLNCLILTSDSAVPVGAVQSFSNADDAVTFFGGDSTEASLARIYFLGYDNATRTPGTLLFAQYPTGDVPAYLRGGSLAGMSLPDLQALSGTLTVTVDGTEKKSSAINLSSAKSFSDAATIIAGAFTALGATVGYDGQRSAFKITSATSGIASAVSFAGGTLAAGLKLAQAQGAVVSQGATAATPASGMDAIKQMTQNWAAFMTAFEPVTDDKAAFSAWTNAQNNSFAYVGGDTDSQALVQGSTTSWAARVKAANYSGSVPIYKDRAVAAFVLAVAASIDFTRTNARITFKFRSQTGLTPSVTDQTTGDTLTANGYNFYGAWASRNNGWAFLAEGQISGPYKWIDTYVNQIWLNDSLQVALLNLLTQIQSVPYNNAGYAMIDAAAMDPINAGLNFGAIRTGVNLSSLQATQINNQAGVEIAPTLKTRGWYFQVQPAAASVRSARQSPPCTLWYTDGGSVHKLNLASLDVQ